MVSWFCVFFLVRWYWICIDVGFYILYIDNWYLILNLVKWKREEKKFVNIDYSINIFMYKLFLKWKWGFDCL